MTFFVLDVKFFPAPKVENMRPLPMITVEDTLVGATPNVELQILLERARRIRAIALDGDGVIFTGHVIEGPEGPLAKVRSHWDGQGLSLLREHGILIAIITAERGFDTKFLEVLVNRWNNLDSCKKGKWKPIELAVKSEQGGKTAAVQKWLEGHGINLEECSYIGDDLNDLDLLRRSGLAVAPANADVVIKKVVDLVLPRKGADGAVRDLANFILTAKGIQVAATESLR